MLVSKGVRNSIAFESFRILGVDCVFSCSHHGIIPPEESGIRCCLLQNEQSAVHAADGYARATGRPGVVFLTTAAGITNSITGIATAYSDSVPLVVIAGTPLNPSNSQTAQELDIIGMTMPITKYSFPINDLDTLQPELKKALEMSTNGRPGPVLIEITKNNIGSPTREEPGKVLPSKQDIPQKRWMDIAKEWMEKAKKPVLFIGGGVISSGAAIDLREIVKHSRIPVVSSLMGIGAMEAGNPLFLGMLGMHGTYAANKAVHHCDLLISIGVRFSDRVTGKVSSFSPNSKKIHVDIDPAEINKIIPADLPIVSDAKEFLFQLKDKLDYEQIRKHADDWVNEAVDWKRTVPRFDKSNCFLSPQTVIQTLAKYSGDETIVVTDVGQHQIWTAHHYRFSKPRTFLSSGGLGTMGYGLPAAIGAAAAFPEKTILCVSGDGSFQMNLKELVTAVKYELPLKMAILNNGYLGMVRQWQELFYNGRYSAVKLSSPHFSKLAEAYGIPGYYAHSSQEAQQVIEAGLKHHGPVLMEFNVVEEENVYPIVPPNHSNHQLILSR
ncbi:biosynthetic-type acetolactate synthase large subunit [Bacillus sp. BRMEA1]|nr:biosynthetic-type acetolactate synthase large subunit [Neobacillus endophyticus]